MSWTDDRVDILRKLWADGLSASQIAAELGGVTRNAVIGKVHRLGLSGRAKNPSTAAARQKRAAGRTSGYAKTTSRATRSPGTSVATTQRQAIVVDVPKPTLLNMDLLELSENTCKWPVGDPQDGDFAFCGNKSRDKDPYCEYHCKLAYQPAAERRRSGQRSPMQNRIASGNR